VRGALVVEREARPVVADPVHALVYGMPRERRDGRRPVRRAPRAVRRSQRVGPEHVLDVHQQQLLVLLLVVQPQLDERGRRVRRVAAHAVEQPRHRVVHVRPVGEHLADRRARGEPALRPAVALAGLHVVRVEQVGVARVGRRVPQPRGRRVLARTNVSKNQLVCARCHFVGLTSGIELTT
jgi:hypothetical protein